MINYWMPQGWRCMSSSIASPGITLEPIAENYSLSDLAKIDINIGPVGAAYRGILDSLNSILKGRTFSAIYIEGLYGSGKTLTLRKAVYDLLSGPFKKDFERIIPIYFFLGEMDFTLLQRFKTYVDEIKAYTQGVLPPRPYILGDKEDWKSRLPILDECSKIASEIEKQYKEVAEREVSGFFELLREMNKRGYYPLLIFDEFERVLYTGEGLKTDAAKKAFALFISKYLELTRGHLYTGVFILATTRPIDELVDRAVNENRPHIRIIAEQLSIPMDKIVSDFPMTRDHIVYSDKFILRWYAKDLDLLAQKYGLVLHEDLINLISLILPVPRAIIQIDRKIRMRLGVVEVVSLKKFYEVIEPRIDDIINVLKREIIPPQAKWHERFIALLKNGYVIVKGQDYNNIAKILEYPDTDPSKARQKVGQILKQLSAYGLFEKIGPREYALSPNILAYALEIERLPDGTRTTKDEVLNKIKYAIKKKKEEEKEKRREKEVKSEEE